MEREKIINEIIEREWIFFTNANNEGGRAECQDNKREFDIMRRSQWETMSTDILESYLEDLENSKRNKVNIVVEKYARMMESTDPERYERVKGYLTEINFEKKKLMEEIIEEYMKLEEEMGQKYPKLCSRGRVLYSKEDTKEQTSIETYLRGELSTYSLKTLGKYKDYISEMKNNNRNIVIENMGNIVKLKGYESIDEAENSL